MPLNLEYLDHPPYRVTPVRLVDGSFGLEINGEIVPINPEKAARGMTSHILGDQISERPNIDQLLGIFLPQAQNKFYAPIYRHDGEPNAHHLIAIDVGISDDEHNRWIELFAMLKSP